MIKVVTWLIILMSSYMLEDVNGMWLVLMRIPFLIWKDIFECCLYNNHMMFLIVLTFGNKMMIYLHKFSKHPRITQCNVLLMISDHTLRILMSIPLSTWIYSMQKIINHCVDRSFSTEVNSHIMKIIYVEDNRVLLGGFNHQHLYSCKRDLRTPARVIM